MIKALRREFMIMNSLLILIVLGGALTGVYLVTWLRIEQSTTVTLARHLSSPVYEQRDGEHPRLFISSIDASAYEYIRDVPASNIFKYFDTLYVNDSFSTAQTDRILAQIVEAGVTDGVLRLEDRHYKYVKQQIDKNTIKIVVLETTNLINNLHSTRNALLLIAAASLPMIFLVSGFTTDRSIKPLEMMLARQMEFFSDISHELRTPLTVAMTNLAVIEAHKEESVASQEKWLGFLKDQLDRLANLVNEMLYLESMNLPQLNEQNEHIDFSYLVDRYIKSLAAILSQKQLTLNAQIQPEIYFYAEREALTRLVSVLVDNAIKYTPEGGTITVSLAQTSRRILLTVRNTGDGIEPRHIDRLFDRLYRVRKSRSTSEGGKGLGLAIAKSVVERYNGNITVQSKLGEHTTFTVSLPRQTGQDRYR